jgi:hypothetical protein
MTWTRLSRHTLILLFPTMLTSAWAEDPELSSPTRQVNGTGAPSSPAGSDSLVAPGAIPLAPDKGYRWPRAYPRLDVGLGLRTFHPDLSGLAGVYGGTPRFNLSPSACVMVELACSEGIGIQLDAGQVIKGGKDEASQGLAGLVSYLRPFANRDIRPHLGAGVAVCSFHGDGSTYAIDAGATGFYISAGLELQLRRSGALDLYGGYCSYPRVSTTHLEGEGSGNSPVKASVDLSNVILGFRFKY